MAWKKGSGGCFPYQYRPCKKIGRMDFDFKNFILVCCWNSAFLDFSDPKFQDFPIPGFPHGRPGSRRESRETETSGIPFMASVNLDRPWLAAVGTTGLQPTSSDLGCSGNLEKSNLAHPVKDLRILWPFLTCHHLLRPFRLFFIIWKILDMLSPTGSI